jgi:aspartyl-tRNA(Asn)/glutamyl-tRNA(Gln) amidotransferase subunit B
MDSEKRIADKKDWIKGATGDWEIIIGLEIHAQVQAKAKLFSGASAEYGGEPNAHVSIVDAAMPGMLPVINRFCVEQAVRTGLGLKSVINNYSVFDRRATRFRSTSSPWWARARCWWTSMTESR